MEPRVSFLPSYSVIAVQVVVDAKESLMDMCAARACTEILNLVSQIGMPLSSLQGIYGLAMLHSDWEQKDIASVVFEECVVLPSEELSMEKFAGLIQLPKRELPYYLKATPAGLYAIASYKGSYKEVEKIYDYMFRQWLPSSQYQFSGGPVLEIYMNDHAKSIADDKAMDICFPIQPCGKHGFGDLVGAKALRL